MDGYITFDGQITPIVLGKAAYTILALPDAVTKALGPTRRVEGEINDHPVNLALTTNRVIDQTFVHTGKSLLTRIGISPGDRVEVRLRPAPDDDVETPEDLALALRRADLSAVWSGLTPGCQRGLLHQISTARRAETRARRIEAVLAVLRDGL